MQIETNTLRKENKMTVTLEKINKKELQKQDLKK